MRIRNIDKNKLMDMVAEEGCFKTLSQMAGGGWMMKQKRTEPVSPFGEWAPLGFILLFMEALTLLSP